MTDIVGNDQFATFGSLDKNGYVSSIARLASGGLVVVYQIDPSGEAAIFAQMLDAAEQYLGAPIMVAANGTGAVVVGLEAGGFAVTWTYQDPTISFNSRFVSERVFDASGTAFGNAVTVSQGSFYGHSDLELTAVGNGNFVVSWLQRNPQFDGTFTLKARTVDGGGTPIGSEVVLDSATQDSNSLITLPNGNALLAYTTKAGGNPITISFRAYDPAGSATASNFASITLPPEIVHADVSLTRLASGRILVSWLAQQDNTVTLLGRIYESSGTATAETFSLATTSNVGQGKHIAALDDGGFVATYTTAQGSAVAQLFDSHAAPVGTAFTVSDSGRGIVTQPAVAAFGTNDFAVVSLYGSGAPGLSGVRSYFDVVNGTSDANLMNGTIAPDILRGLEGADTINGLAGNDYLSGGAGGDTIDGGTGSDTALYDDSSAAVTINLAQLTAAGGAAAGDTLIAIENLVGSAFGDALTGDAGANQLEGGAGADTLKGGAGADTLIGGTGIDLADYSASQAGVTVDLAAGTTSGGDAQGDRLSELENLRGSAFDDGLTGNDAANLLEGFGGNDTLAGGINADTLDGGAGKDTVSYAASANRVTVDLSSSAIQQGGDAQGDRLIAIENVTGSAGNDVLTGSASANEIRGGGGDDTMTGAAGIDTLTGGIGNDVFRDTAAGLNGDTITDFAIGDKIHFADANPASFTFSRSGSTLTFSGGTLTLGSALPQGTHLVVSAAAGGGVTLSLSGETYAAHASNFNGSGGDDIYWRKDDGSALVWLGDDKGGFTASAGSPVSADWHVAGTGDFNGDGFGDLAWLNDDGTFGTWLGTHSSGFVIQSASTLAKVSADWQVIGTGDFNGDHLDDLLWRSNGGTLGTWSGTTNGGFVANDATLSQIANDWHVYGTGDFNGDGRSDILWRNDNGSVGTWQGTATGGAFAVKDGAALVPVSGDWHIVGAGDFNGDRIDDILWRSDSGAVGTWLGTASGTFEVKDTQLPSASADWHIVGIGDFNADQRDDIMWQNDNGTVGDWLGQAGGGFQVNDVASAGFLPGWQFQPSYVVI